MKIMTPQRRARERTARERTARQRGATLIELMLSVFMMGLLTAVVLGMVSSAARTAEKSDRQFTLESQNRRALDQMLRQVRSANQVLVSATISTSAYATSATNVVIEAPGFDGSSSQGILSGVYDVIAYRYNATARTLTETTYVDVGSRRAARRDYVLARNVAAVTFQYKIRDQFLGDGSKTTFVTSGRAQNTPQAYINGALATCTYSSTTRSATVSPAPANGADIQFLYSVSPTADGGQWLAFVNSIEATLTTSQQNSRGQTQSLLLAGSARLRNQRT